MANLIQISTMLRTEPA